jgi:predicted HD superfamily hydrolase involved in NAD metabolism
VDEERARAASFLHDIAKMLPKTEQTALARELGMSEAELASYPIQVLHGPVAALIARKELGVDDSEVLQAIAAHSTGCAGMSGIAKVVLIADYIEETRSFPGAEELRSHGAVTLDELTIAILRRKLNHLIEANKDIDPRAIALWNELIVSL